VPGVGRFEAHQEGLGPFQGWDSVHGLPVRSSTAETPVTLEYIFRGGAWCHNRAEISQKVHSVLITKTFTDPGVGFRCTLLVRRPV